MYSSSTALYVIQQRNKRGVVSLVPDTRTPSLQEVAHSVKALREGQRVRPVNVRLEYRVVRLQPLGSWA